MESWEQEVPPETWQMLESRWRSILGQEAAIESQRAALDSLRVEMENASKRALNVEAKVHATQFDVLQWNKAKGRVHFALPKVREFIHRATWATGIPERKKMEAIFKDHIEPRVPFPELNQTSDLLDFLQKDRQVLAAQGNTIAQECRGIIAEINRTLSTLERNAATNARNKRDAKKERGRY